MPITFSPPRVQPEVFFMKAHIFLSITPKFQLQIHYTLEVLTENAPTSGIPIFIFSCNFLTASSPVSHTCFCLRREIKSKHELIVQNVSYGSRLISFEWKLHMLKWA